MSSPVTRLPDDVVSAEWLATHLDDSNVQVVDIRGYVKTEDLGGGRQSATYTGARDEYLEAHIPGATYIDWTTDIVDPDAEVKAQVAPPDRFAAVIGAAGVGDRTSVVVVDHAGGHLATRLWWALRYYGHENVGLLDGGFKRWEALGLPVEAGEHRAAPETFTPRPRPSLWSCAADVLAVVETGDRQIVDARDTATYSGEVQRGSRGGHIPSAINLPTRELLTDEGLWKSPEEIRAAAAKSGIDPEAPVTAYCNGGVTATAVLFGLHRAGLQDISNYDGSWNEWGERLDLPAEGNQDLFNKA